MPFEIKPIGGEAPAYKPPSYSPSWDWLAKQPYSRDVATNQIGSYRPGSVEGGPSSSTYDLLADPRKYAIFAPAPAITDAAQTRQKAFGRFGTVTLDLVDPFMTIQSVSQGLGVGEQQAGEIARAPQTFLGERDIDPFGQGAAGVPARLFDYATGWIGALYDQAAGKPIAVPQPIADSALQYNFQRDPAYYPLIAGANDAQLAGLAQQVAGQYASGDNAYLADKLLAQFKIDRERASGRSSGDRRVDYMAKLAFQRDLIAEGTGGITAEEAKRQGLSYMEFQHRATNEQGLAAALQFPLAIAGALPFVGADIQEAIYQPPAKVEAAWADLSPDQRQSYFGEAGANMLLGDAYVWLPLLSGIGAVEAAAMRSGGVAARAFKAYEYTRNVTTAVMATGLLVATGNWAAEAAVPGYAESFGKRLDYARPISGSNLAGLINQIGFFSSGTFGGYTAARLVGRVAGKVASLSPIKAGVRELSYYRNVFGGSEIRTELAGTNLPDAGVLDLAPQSEFTSHLLNWIEASRRQVAEAIAKGHPSYTALDELNPEARLAAANDLLLHSASQSSVAAEGIVKALAEARRPRPILAGEAQRMHDAAAKLARYVDDEMARLHAEEYGPAWITRLTGSYTSRSMERYAQDTVARLGGDPARLGAHDEAGWSQVIRSLHSYEFHHNNGLLQAAAEGSEEAPRLLLMQADHLFANDVDTILASLRGDDAALAQATAASTVRNKREAAEWFAQEWSPEAGVSRAPESVPPAELADWIEEIRAGLPNRRAAPAPGTPTADMPLNAFQLELEGNKLWTLGFKATDEAGNAISYVTRPNGRVFKSPWVDYPMATNEAIELGNRGLILSKADGITRGFRTWRLVEFQKGLLYRRLTGRLDVSAEQVERFHAGLMRLGRETGAQVQTLGAISRATSPIFGKELVQEKLDRLVAEVFGPGPFVNRRTGKPETINWYDEIAKSYRQSFRLNLTAGLTSYLKANLGEIGSQIAWASDIGYVAWRFNLSPIFKGGELVESWQLNAMRGVRDMDATTRALYLRAGVGNDFGAFGAELPFDPLVQGSAGSRPTYVHDDPSARFAASAAFYARHMPDDFTAAARKAFEQRAAEDMRAVHGGGQMPTSGWFAKPTGRVVAPDAIPDGYTIELGDVLPDYLDPDVLAADQGIWHATTALSKVYEQGVKAGREVDVVTRTPRVGEGFKAWRERLPSEERLYDPTQLGPGYIHLSASEFRGWEGGGFMRTPATHMGLAPRAGEVGVAPELIRDPEQLLDRKGGYLVEIDYTYLPGEGMANSIDFGARNRVWRWNADQGDYVLTYASPYTQIGETYAAGLGGGSGLRVSTTYRQEHADTIAARIRFSALAARNQVTAAEIIDHFADWYGDDFVKMARVLGLVGAIGGKVKLVSSEAGLVKALERDAGNGATKYKAVQDLDAALPQSGPNDEFGGSVILVGSYEQVLRVNPDDVGVVRLAVDKSYTPKGGADAFELEYPSDKLLVVDDRDVLGPLADTEDGLLVQLKATLADQPKAGQMTVADYMVGGNGFAPGLEDRARRILTRLEDIQAGRLDGGPTFGWDEIGPTKQAEFRERLRNEGWALRDQTGWSAAERTRLDGTQESRIVSDLYDEYQRRPGAADSLDDVAGTPEAIFDGLLGEERAAEQTVTATGWRKNAWDTFWHPAKWKLERATELQIKLARDEFPGWLRLSGNDGLAQVLRDIGVPESRWLDWLVEDRVRLQRWVDSSSADDFAALLNHAGDSEAARGAFNDLYASEEWASLSALIGANLKSASQEAFGVHFFSPYRSPLERSLNHPLLGLYPASWSFKVAREWAKFLFDNRTLGINLGMAPAQAIAQLVHDQHATFAQMNDQDLDTWLQNGPLGSPLFIFNLLLPGDWSALPFALSRTVRDYARPALAGEKLPDAGEVFANNLRTIGLTRDARLFFESVGQIGDLLRGPVEEVDPARVVRHWSVRGGEGLTYEPARR